jgi:hypothetical protein
MPTSKRPQTTIPSIRGYPARSLKVRRNEEVVDYVIAEVAMSGFGSRSMMKLAKQYRSLSYGV